MQADVINDRQLCAKKTECNTATGTLKLIALVFMVIDHAGVIFFSGKAPFLTNLHEMRVLGRIAFPIYAWCICVGCMYTRDIRKYLLRLLIVGVISQPFYAAAMGHKWYEFNIFSTLAMGVLGIAGIRSKKIVLRVLLPVIALGASLVLSMDYGWKGVLFILLLYMSREKKASVAAVTVSFCLFWGFTSGSALKTLLGINVADMQKWLPFGSNFFSSIMRTQTFAMLALPFMLIPMRDVRLPKWLSYSLYPAHLLILYVLKNVLATAQSIPGAVLSDYMHAIFNAEYFGRIFSGSIF